MWMAVVIYSFVVDTDGPPSKPHMILYHRTLAKMKVPSPLFERLIGQ